jgi:hypothetical protein
MIRVTHVETGPDWTLNVTFSDGVTGCVSLEDRLFGPMFEPLRDPAVFSQAFVDDFGAVCWPSGADVAPDGLHARVQAEAEARSAVTAAR